jgi:hypothetical protein
MPDSVVLRWLKQTQPLCHSTIVLLTPPFRSSRTQTWITLRSHSQRSPVSCDRTRRSYTSVRIRVLSGHTRGLSTRRASRRWHPGYRHAGRYEDAAGISPKGLRAKVGATHLPLGLLLKAFLDAGFALEHLEEPGDREYPHLLALRLRNWRRPERP